MTIINEIKKVNPKDWWKELTTELQKFLIDTLGEKQKPTALIWECQLHETHEYFWHKRSRYGDPSPFLNDCFLVGKGNIRRVNDYLEDLGFNVVYRLHNDRTPCLIVSAY